jgi:hypothetical protein
MKLKHANGWFAAGPEMARAMALLSDGAFKLFVYLCLQANRDTARIAVNDGDLALLLQKSRRSIVSYLDELERHGVCQIASALNQHRRGWIEICDAFWPYQKTATPAASADLAGYVQQIRKLLATRPSVQISFTAADEKLATTLWAEQVPLEQIERAIVLACTRKHVSWCNGQVSGPITSLQYFRGPIEEVANTQVGADYYRYLEFRLKPLEAQWLKTQTRLPVQTLLRQTEKAERRNDVADVP